MKCMQTGNVRLNAQETGKDKMPIMPPLLKGGGPPPAVEGFN